MTAELPLMLEAVQDRINITENQISNVVDKCKINAEKKNKERSGAERAT